MPRSKIPNPISKIKKFLKKKKKVKLTIRAEAYFFIVLVLSKAKVSDYRIARNAV
jgi:ribosomal protein L1